MNTPLIDILHLLTNHFVIVRENWIRECLCKYRAPPPPGQRTRAAPVGTHLEHTVEQRRAKARDPGRGRRGSGPR